MSKPTTQRMIALLRGVNVGGVKVTSVELRAMFLRDIGDNVNTVLASGNVAFDVDASTAESAQLKANIEGALCRTFGYDAWIVLLSQQRLVQLAEDYPFPRSDETDHPYVVFSSNAEVAAELGAAGAEILLESESLAVGEGVLYWRVPKGASLDTPFAKLLAKSRYKPHITTRNLRTVERLATA